MFLCNGVTTTCSILKYCSRDCSLEFASKQLHNIPSAMHVAIYKLVRIIKQQARIMFLLAPCMEYCGQAEIVYAFQWIEKKVKKGRIKELPWRSG